MLWVTITIVFLSCLASSSNRSSIFLLFSVSNAPVGSSQNKISQFFDNALAIATLCCSPPDNSFGYDFFFSNKPTFFKISSILFFESLVNNIFSYTVNSLIKLNA